MILTAVKKISMETCFSPSLLLQSLRGRICGRAISRKSTESAARSVHGVAFRIQKSPPKKEGQSRTDYRELHSEFPELVDENGGGWFYRHVHSVIDFVQDNPDTVMKSAAQSCKTLASGFDDAWRKKVMQFQVPLFSTGTKGAWVLRFDDVLSEALELGRLRNDGVALSSEQLQALSAATPKGVPETVLSTLAKYYLANKPENSEWVVLPVTNLDAYFGTTSFSRKWLNKLPESVLVRENGYGVCRYRMFV